MSNHFYIYRSSEPTQQDSAEKNTICKVDCGSDGYDIYYQLGKDEERPYWVFIGRFPQPTPNTIIEQQIKERFG